MYSSTLLCRQNPIQTNVICNYNLFLQTPLRVGLLSIAKIKATFIKCLFNGWYYSNGLLINWLINVKSTLISYSWLFNGSRCSTQYKIKPVHHVKKVAHTRLPRVGFRSWSRFLAVTLQVMRVTNPAVGCHYFPPGLHLPSQPLRGLLPISLLGEQRHNGCEQFA